MSNFPLRLPRDLMEDARTMAKDQGVSLNHFMATVLAQRVGEMKMMTRLQGRAASGSPAAALEVLARAPGLSPLIGDEIS